ncbi:DUF4270 family protein [Anaerophaga thermohalophila]|uniref:DUF4270 family protein n=1 Tax=Anaerophaga thermohalophila TaxID=177400 RepID=UPI000237CE0E|nr:DUF4270 family protein [Anaerophaga thermohalophila]
MLNKRKIRFLLPFLMVAVAVFVSCENDTGTLGLDVLPQDELFSGADEIAYMPVSNENPTRFRSDDVDYTIIGSIDDPYAGKTGASFITQVNIGEFIGTLNKSDSLHEYFVDSLVLNLAYRRNYWFGDKDARHSVRVYRYTEPLNYSTDYYSDMEVEGLYDPAPVGERISSAWDALTDSVWEDPNYIHQWQIKLNNNLAEEVFNYSEDVMNSRETFKTTFGALFVKSELLDSDTPGSLIRINILASQSNMRLYYSYNVIDSVTNEADTTMHRSYTFPINEECVRINRFTHDHDGQVEFSTPDAERFVVQGMAGSYVKVDFNDVELKSGVGLFEFWEEKLSANTSNNPSQYHGISAVDIYFEADTTLQFGDENFYSPIPQALALNVMNDDGELKIPSYYYLSKEVAEAEGIEDYKEDWSPQFEDGTYNNETGQYRFRMSRETFRMMVEKPELRGPYYLAPYNTTSYPWRVVLKNNPYSENAVPYLRVKYVSVSKE